MTTNAFNRFQTLVGHASTDVVTITANNGDGTSSATTLGGTPVIVKGESVSAGNKAFIRNGEVIRPAPNHTITQVTI